MYIATVRYTIETTLSIAVSWQMHIVPHILESCGGIIRSSTGVGLGMAAM